MQLYKCMDTVSFQKYVMNKNNLQKHYFKDILAGVLFIYTNFGKVIRCQNEYFSTYSKYHQQSFLY